MKLSNEAFHELKNILQEEFGDAGLSRFTEDMIHEFGTTLLNLGAACLKARTATGCRTQKSMVQFDYPGLK